ncbi:MAG: hypothetical protein K0Q73_5943, partial [Paenibacillus sp.]|nr:hypothetical protein [Paenibacillus sp.]
NLILKYGLSAFDNIFIKADRLLFCSYPLEKGSVHSAFSWGCAENELGIGI